MRILIFLKGKESDGEYGVTYNQNGMEFVWPQEASSLYRYRRDVGAPAIKLANQSSTGKTSVLWVSSHTNRVNYVSKRCKKMPHYLYKGHVIVPQQISNAINPFVGIILFRKLFPFSNLTY